MLLTGTLGDPERKPLTVSQFRILTQRMRCSEVVQGDEDVAVSDLMDLGYRREMAEHIVSLLQEDALLEYYLRQGKSFDCTPITRISRGYPDAVRRKLGLESPGCLWAKGDLAILETKCIALVGSRDIRPENEQFAVRVGMQAAKQGFTLISGNARGADAIAQQACLEHGGRVICVVADMLMEKQLRNNVLYLSEEGYDRRFSAQRALSRNRLIHALGEKTFVAQASLRTGGTWDGTVKNLSGHWSPVFCFADGSPAAEELVQLGAQGISLEKLENLHDLQNPSLSFFDQ